MTMANPPKVAITKDRFKVNLSPILVKIYPPVANARMSEHAEAVVLT